MLLLAKMKWTKWNTAITLLLAILTLVAAWLVVPEFRKWVGLDKSPPIEQAQQTSISGIVVDSETNRGVGQASILFVGRTEQYVTEDSGNFKIDLPSDAPKRVRLRVNKDGFQTLDTTVEPPADNLVLPLHKQ